MSKTAYVTPGSLPRKVTSWKRQIAGYERHPYAIRPDRTALLVIDMQSYFTSPDSHAFLPASGAIIPQIARLVSMFRKDGMPVIFTRHVDLEGRGGLMGVWWKAPIRAGDPMSRLDPRVDAEGCRIIRKHRYSAFAGTRLASMLRRENVDTVAISGVMTHLCCETTAREAFMRDIQVAFLMDGTATQDEALHVSSLRTLADGFAEVMTCRELQGRLGWK